MDLLAVSLTDSAKSGATFRPTDAGPGGVGAGRYNRLPLSPPSQKLFLVDQTLTPIGFEGALVNLVGRFQA